MNTKYSREDLERILEKMERDPNDGVKDRIKAVKKALELLDQADSV